MKKTHLPALLVASATLFATPLASALSFLPYQSTALGGQPISVAVGDVTGDGLDDVVLTTSASDYKLYVFAQQPDGTLAAPETASCRPSEGSNCGAVALADWNGDGTKDIIVGEGAGVAVFPGGKPLVAGLLTSLFAHGELVAAADVNHDGNVDIVSQGVGQPWVAIYEGDGHGGVRRRVYAQLRGGRDMKVADLDHDGFADITGTSDVQGSDVLSVLYNNGARDPAPIGRGAARHEAPDPRYTTLPMQLEPGYEHDGAFGPAGVAVGDFNHDGRTDVATSEWLNRPGSAVSLFLQQADGRLGAPSRLSSYDLPGTLLGADLDGDDADDLLALHDGWRAVGYYLQTPTGFADEVLLPLPFGNSYPRSGLAVGDVNHDGTRDIVLVTDIAGLVILYGAP
jgi:hypothetical protein